MKVADQFKATNRQLAEALTPHETRDSEDGEEINVRVGRSRMTVRAGNAAEVKKKLGALKLRRSPITQQRCGRSFPKFKPGMSTRQYVQLYAVQNGSDAQVLWRGDEYNALNEKPAALYEGDALDFEPVVEIEAEEVEECDVLDLV